MGLDLIAANNGWAMAVTGAIIVMIGLSGLAFVISQLHKVLALFDTQKPAPPANAAEAECPPIEVVDWLCDPGGAARVCQLFTAHMGEGFKLTALYEELVKNDCPHPHLTIRAWREQGILVPAEKGHFCWKQDS